MFLHEVNYMDYWQYTTALKPELHYDHLIAAEVGGEKGGDDEPSFAGERFNVTREWVQYWSRYLRINFPDVYRLYNDLQTQYFLEGYGQWTSRVMALRFIEKMIGETLRHPRELFGIGVWTVPLGLVAIASAAIMVVAIAARLRDEHTRRIWDESRYVMRHQSRGWWADVYGWLAGDVEIWGPCEPFLGIIMQRERFSDRPGVYGSDEFNFHGGWVEQWWAGGFWETRVVEKMKLSFVDYLVHVENVGYVSASDARREFRQGELFPSYRRAELVCQEPSYHEVPIEG